ncbi:MAG: ORF6N domain-containing protein [Crocinitomicaceae bacterium]|nr:ORF6N domain-containing protein [Crocinitomicaceae bacterium]
MNEETNLSHEIIVSKILMIRGQKIMLDSDLAQLYQVETKQLKRQVRRNIERFPEDFVFVLTKEEFDNLRSHFGSSSYGGQRYLPMVFTEQGVSMLSSVLKSPVAISVSIQIIRVFTKMRELLLSNKELLIEMEVIRSKAAGQDERIEAIFNYLQQFVQEKNTERKRVGY